MLFTDLARELRRLVRDSLPGVDAQLPLAPKPRPGWNPRHLPDGARSAAALLLVFAKAGEACVPLTQRAAALTSHPGQVSLPGGSIDPGETIEQAALREAREEIGLDGRLVEILGPLTPLYIPVSGFTLHPVVGLCEQTPPLRPTTDEVERIIEVTIDDLLDASRLRTRETLRDGSPFLVPYFDLGGGEVWGATAMVLAEFRALIGFPVL